MEKIAHILLPPRITEKGAYLSEAGAYVFNVATSANKTQIMAAIKKTYNVTPRKVNVVTVPRKVVQTRNTNRKGATVGGKKAYVFLKKGETIDII
ncbi:MAG TPA: 50S ribosomal protein L23 [Candidatus Paceibacterota bacterium]|nr:50S ribosomal protein L23 [Candidatus Paceibacterota bacterium]